VYVLVRCAWASEGRRQRAQIGTTSERSVFMTGIWVREGLAAFLQICLDAGEIPRGSEAKRRRFVCAVMATRLAWAAARRYRKVALGSTLHIKKELHNVPSAGLLDSRGGRSDIADLAGFGRRQRSNGIEGRQHVQNRRRRAMGLSDSRCRGKSPLRHARQSC